MMSRAPSPAGVHICSFVVEAVYPGKQPFLVGSFTVEAGATWQETEARADAQKREALRSFFAQHFPDDVAPPAAVRARMGSVIFVPAEA